MFRFSNFGPCVDLMAPGVAIKSLDYTDEKGYNDKDGTSMACPHVSGVAALLLQQDMELTADQVRPAES